MRYDLQYKRYAENAILIEWPSEIDEILLQDLLFYKKSIEKYCDEVILEVISSYNSLLILYVSTIEDFYGEVFMLKSLYVTNNSKENKNKLWRLPVCYDKKFAPDLEDFAMSKSLSVEDVIVLHTSPIYTVYFIGFLPGFLYLGGLNDKLILPRKSTPARMVKRGSVALGGNQTGVYPMDSPGGWHVIGNCPLSFFDIKSAVPCFVSPGDKIQFISIEEKEYNEISTSVSKGFFLPDSIAI
ncbi:5-oxoprolinase subunit PxpB [Aquimarina sp. MMG016]|uniref:5-oxoprolinase subunit PxpB n=1 Tax=Aquimarina sp. MMG016 TaxID=2822690 RepID=UPI001B3A1E08|nr:5-oxoprolinase subunit PxpB [Aquimarina sp. MMG016]MBQ4821031.1 5-oxoprolinase subunit PxpB [Aquimarina sp. MMG016]